MTRLAILADIHGNLPALDAIRRDLVAFAVDQVVVAGDLINFGPFSAQVFDAVREAGWAVIRGNHEYYLLDYQTARAPAEWDDPRRWGLLAWLMRQMGEERRHLIAAWPDTLSLRFPDAPPILVAHGTPRSPWDAIRRLASDEEIAEKLAGVSESLVIVGHTHLLMDRRGGPWRVLNPGSAGNPLDGIPTASYLILESREGEWRPSFRRVAFDRDAVLREFERQRIVEEGGVIGHFVVEEFRTARPEVSPFLRWHARCCPNAPLNMELLSDYARVDRWEYRGKNHRVNVDIT